MGTTGGGSAGGTSGTAGGTSGTAGGTSGTGGGSASAGGAAGGSVTPSPQAITSLSAGASSTCAVLADKTVKCWGRNNEGQLGNGTTMDSVRPVAVMGLTTATQVSVGYEHACARLEDGTARCWGTSATGQLGNNSTMRSLVPVQVMGLSNVASVHAGVYISCARLTDGTVSCWGRGGDTGNGIVANTLVPAAVQNLTNVTQLSVSPNSGAATPVHVCGVRGDGTAFCWGANDDGQCGDGTQNSARRPVNVMGITDALEISAGGTHACARRTSGLFCWGTAPQIGDGTVERKFVPTRVMTTETVDQLEVGNSFSLARTPAKGLICWGQNGRGGCGDGAAFTPGGPSYSAPIASRQTDVAFFVSGGSHACAYVAATQVTWCWGSNDYGEIGYGTPSQPSRTSTPDFVRW